MQRQQWIKDPVSNLLNLFFFLKLTCYNLPSTSPSNNSYISLSLPFHSLTLGSKYIHVCSFQIHRNKNPCIWNVLLWSMFLKRKSLSDERAQQSCWVAGISLSVSSRSFHNSQWLFPNFLTRIFPPSYFCQAARAAGNLIRQGVSWWIVESERLVVAGIRDDEVWI